MRVHTHEPMGWCFHCHSCATIAAEIVYRGPRQGPYCVRCGVKEADTAAASDKRCSSQRTTGSPHPSLHVRKREEEEPLLSARERERLLLLFAGVSGGGTDLGDFFAAWCHGEGRSVVFWLTSTKEAVVQIRCKQTNTQKPALWIRMKYSSTAASQPAC